jgi:hypothetical protein
MTWEMIFRLLDWIGSNVLPITGTGLAAALFAWQAPKIIKAFLEGVRKIIVARQKAAIPVSVNLHGLSAPDLPKKKRKKRRVKSGVSATNSVSADSSPPTALAHFDPAKH